VDGDYRVRDKDEERVLRGVPSFENTRLSKVESFENRRPSRLSEWTQGVSFILVPFSQLQIFLMCVFVLMFNDLRVTEVGLLRD
jgi:hypothetical protein